MRLFLIMFLFFFTACEIESLYVVSKPDAGPGVDASEGIPDSGPYDTTPYVPVKDYPDTGPKPPIEPPDIEISPASLTMDEQALGCLSQDQITITNVGGQSLIIRSIVFSSTDDFAISYPNVPRLAHGESVSLDINFLPLSGGPKYSFVTVVSNDPDEPELSVRISARGDDSLRNTDTFRTSLVPSIDVLLVIDNSGSMHSPQESIRQNLGAFLSNLEDYFSDYRIAVITTDNPIPGGPPVLSSDPNRLEVLTLQTNVGTSGSGRERGFMFAYESINNGFFTLRDEAQLLILFISDEDDAGQIQATTYATRYQAFKASPSMVSSYAFVGDVPQGCAFAEPAFRFRELTRLLNGLIYSICEPQWENHLTEMTERMSALSRIFHLSQTPAPQTIRVSINNTPISALDFSYNEQTNEVRLNINAPLNSRVNITYAIFGVCD